MPAGWGQTHSRNNLIGQSIKFPLLGMFPGAIQLTRIDVVQKSKLITMKRDSNSVMVFHGHMLASLEPGEEMKTS